MGVFDWFGGKPKKELTPREYVQKMKRDFPFKSQPDGQPEYGEYLYSLLERRLPPDIRVLFTNEKALVGQLGIRTPNAFTERIGQDGFAVLIHSGLPRFIYEISRVMFGNANIWSDGKIEQKGTVSAEEKVEIISSIYFDFIKRDKVEIKDDYIITKKPIGFASDHATRTEMFVLGHEIGHIALWQGKESSTEISYQDEIDADQYGLCFILGLWGEPDSMKNQSKRMTYAGAEFFLRIYAGLEHIGYPFKNTHPLPSSRLAEFRKSTLKMAGNQRNFIKLSTMAFAYDQFLEKIEQEIAQKVNSSKFVVGMTPERALSSLSVLIEECAKGGMELKVALEQVIKYLDYVDAKIIHEAAKMAMQIYFIEVPVNGSTSEIAFAEKEKYVFKEIVKGLPESYGKIFKEYLQPYRFQ